jgi:hypothetical protein
MYTGNLIEGLMETVERAEEHARMEQAVDDLAVWATLAQYETKALEQNLLGVA